MPTKVHLVKAMVFPAVIYRCESWTIKKAECWRINAFELWCWRRLLRVPWTARRSNQSILKEINPEYSLEGLSWSWSSNTLATWWEEPTHWRSPWCWERLKAEEKGTTEDEMAGWHHWINGHEFEQALGVGDGQGRLPCCNPWGHKELDTTERLNWTECTCFSGTLLIHPTLSCSHCVHKSVLYVCVSIIALQMGSSVPTF